ncbi:hypothetical protein PILCRDRAFT_656121 [Piloderma croceum F 1598]|uniref:Uncharacterized protein n=1 Tax=Piloderma croceum (strain F 1598) TaxID=765440 RepID=A0A0C3EUH6_PILCF|nr:hypothetical protein PILCRDRAFT_656121 [Piloderma croceum F 1598]
MTIIPKIASVINSRLTHISLVIPKIQWPWCPHSWHQRPEVSRSDVQPVGCQWNHIDFARWRWEQSCMVL